MERVTHPPRISCLFCSHPVQNAGDVCPDCEAESLHALGATYCPDCEGPCQHHAAEERAQLAG